MPVTKIFLIFFGSLFLCIGILGIFIPGLPTTPFLLLAAALYLRGSEKLYKRLINNRYIGHHIAEFQRNKGMALKVKLLAILTMWCMIGISVHFVIKSIWIKFLVIGLGIIGTIVMGLVIPTIWKSKPILWGKYALKQWVVLTWIENFSWLTYLWIY